MNPAGEILSVVAAEAGAGPFALVANVETTFTDLIDVNSRVVARRTRLDVGPLRIDASCARDWNARPRWEDVRRAFARGHAPLHALMEWLRTRAPSDSLAHVALRGSGGCRESMKAMALEAVRRPMADLYAGIARGNRAMCGSAARGLAGLGAGLTPAGDDFLLGAMVAIWSTHSRSEAAALAGSISEEAVWRTTSLSAAWLRSAARGEVAAPWHDLIDGIAQGDRDAVLSAARHILNTGHTSGADALVGFVVGLDAALPLAE